MAVRPIGERVLVRRIQGPKTTRSGLHMPEIATPRLERGVVIAVGDWPFLPPLHTGQTVLFSPYHGHETDDGLILDVESVLGVEFESE